MSTPARVRFAPSPTGYLHIGNLRTALYNWFFARKQGGTFVVRMEDTDRNRLIEDAITSLLRTLKICGIEPDEGLVFEEGVLKDKGAFGPYLQSKRREQHLAYAYELIKRDAAYYCFCSQQDLDAMRAAQAAAKQPVMYDRRCRSIPKEVAENRAAVGDSCVIRMKIPLEGVCEFEDLIRGKIEVQWSQVDDQVLIKSDGYPTYHLAAICDDHDMGITHIIRGEDWISSTPKQVFLLKSMGWDLIKFAHMPLILNPDRSKLSKRQGDVAVEDYLAKGYLPEALVNFIALLGWNPTGDREVYSKEELAQLFDVTKVNKSGAVFNLEKLEWLNGQYLRMMSEAEYLALAEPALAEAVADPAQRSRAALLFRDRATRVQLLPELVTPWLATPTVDASMLVWKTQTNAEAHERLAVVRAWLADRDETVFASLTDLETQTKAWIAEKGWGNGEVLWPLRMALSGAKQSPSPFELLYLLGKSEGLKRIDAALVCLA